MSTPANLSPHAFAGTAEFYARYRPSYPDAMMDKLTAMSRERTRLLDLAAGPGRVALALASSFREVWAVDAEPEMIAVGEANGVRRGIVNTVWKTGRAEDLDAPDGHFDLITVGEAFHRLDQRAILASARNWLKPRGIFATMGGTGILQGAEPWQIAVADLVRRTTRDVFPDGWATAKQGAVIDPGAVMQQVEDAGFTDVATHLFVEQYVWTVDTIAGYLQSTSVCSPAVLGDRRNIFLVELESILYAHDARGRYPELMEFGCTVARKPD